MAESKLFLLVVVLTVLFRNESLPRVAAEVTNDAIDNGGQLEYVPERRPRIHGGWNTREDRHLYAHVNLKWEDESLTLLLSFPQYFRSTRPTFLWIIYLGIG